MKKLNSDSFKLLEEERKRQREAINLIPSENYVSRDVLAATGSVFTNKYSEGYPGRRYYPGNEIVDKVEKLAQKKAKEVFSLDNRWHVNVQPYSGSPANLAIYFGLLDFGDKILGLKLSHGGHLTHGHKVSITGSAYKSVKYYVEEDTGRIDYNKVAKIAQEEKPNLIVCGATAYPRQINFKKFGQIAKDVGAYLLADISHIAGLVACSLHPSPFEAADCVMTTTHKTLRGPRSAIILCRSELAEKIDKAVFPGLQGGPHDHITFAKLVCFLEALKPEFRDYQKRIIDNARALAEELKSCGFQLVSGGTDTHLLLVNLRRKINASKAEKLLEKANILANRNTIPGDDTPYKPSGLRLGTPAATTRGFGAKEMTQIAKWMDAILSNKRKPEAVKREVIKLCKKYPLND